jgi:transposase
LKSFGIKLGNVQRKDFASKVYANIGSDELMVQAIEPLLTALDHMEESFDVIDKTVRRSAHDDPICRRLMTIPGMGEITALAFRATVETPDRFRKAKDIGPFLGVIPRKYASGEVDRNGNITKCGDRTLRAYMYESGVVILTRLKKSCALKDWCIQIARRSSFKKAAVALARKLAVICLRIWKDNAEFNWNDDRQAIGPHASL